MGNSNRGRRWTSFLICCAATMAGVGGPAGAQESIDELVRYVDQAVADWETPGLTLALVKGGEVVLAKGFGERQLGSGAPVDEDTLFAIGSCSKAFGSTATALLTFHIDAGGGVPILELVGIGEFERVQNN